MALDHPLCPRCDGYIIDGTLKRTAMTLSSRCRCNDEPWETALEAELRARAALPADTSLVEAPPLDQLTETRPDPLKDAA